MKTLILSFVVTFSLLGTFVDKYVAPLSLKLSFGLFRNLYKHKALNSNTISVYILRISCFVEFSAGQYHLSKITLAGGTSNKGRLNAELTDTEGNITANVPVCGSVDFITATFLCQNLGYLITTGYGTVTELE